MIESDRLLVRPWRSGDRERYLATCNTPAVTHHLGGPAGVAAVDAALARIADSQAREGFSFWAVERRADGAFLGYCGLKRIADIPALAGEIEIGWRLREDAWHQGYAFEAATACLDWTWRTQTIDRVHAFTVPANAPSRRLMERLGMMRVPGGDFDHPALAADSPLRRHVLYRIARPA